MGEGTHLKDWLEPTSFSADLAILKADLFMLKQLLQLMDPRFDESSSTTSFFLVVEGELFVKEGLPRDACIFLQCSC